MWILEEGQILPYLRIHYPVFDQSGPVDIQCIGAPEGEEKPLEPDEGGLINYIFRVSNGKQSVIVKQGRSTSRKNDKIVLPIWRNRQEYETLRLRHAIVPQYTPETYYVDWENAVFLMEDVSDLAQVRKLLCSGVMLLGLAEQVGEFVAASTFYCSEFYLEADLFRRLSTCFRNSDMRSIMENWVFLRDAPCLPHNGTPCSNSLSSGMKDQGLLLRAAPRIYDPGRDSDTWGSAYVQRVSGCSHRKRCAASSPPISSPTCWSSTTHLWSTLLRSGDRMRS